MNWVLETEYLVFSGGGVRGLAFLGAYQVLMNEFRKVKRDLYSQIKGFAGSSAGAFMALVTCLGCDEEELLNTALRLEGPDMMKHIDVLLMSSEWGLYDKQRIVQYLRYLLKQHAQNEDITFQELYDHTRKMFVVSAVCLNTGKMQYFSVDTTPHLEVWRAVMASMAIPLFFAPSRIGQNLYVDGAMAENLPLKIFPLDKTLAFLLTRNMMTPQILGFRDYIQRILYVPLDALQTEQVKQIPQALQNRIVRINTGNVSPIEFQMTDTEKQELIMLGAVAMHRIMYPEVLLSQTRHLVLQSVVQYLSLIQNPLQELAALPTNADKIQIKSM